MDFQVIDFVRASKLNDFFSQKLLVILDLLVES